MRSSSPNCTIASGWPVNTPRTIPVTERKPGAVPRKSAYRRMASAGLREQKDRAEQRTTAAAINTPICSRRPIDLLDFVVATSVRSVRS